MKMIKVMMKMILMMMEVRRTRKKEKGNEEGVPFFQHV